MQMWVSIASDGTCAAALQQAVVDFGVVDTDTLQAVMGGIVSSSPSIVHFSNIA